MPTRWVIRLSEAQFSALQCQEFDGFEDPDEGVLVTGLDHERRRLTVTPDTRAAMWRALNEASNAEDAQAQADMKRCLESAMHARRAARSLGTLAGKVLKIGVR